jgi:hypothetical protein
MNGAIELCKNFAFIGGAGVILRFDWLGFDTSYKNADFVVEAKTIETGTVRFIAETSTDGVILAELGTTDLNTVARTVTPITSGLLPMIRLTLTAQGAATRGIVSAYLLPKRE